MALPGVVVWNGTPQDCMDHLRGSHAVSSEVKAACLGRFFPHGLFGERFGLMASNPVTPRKPRRMSRRVRPTWVQDMSASVLSPVAVSDQAPGAIIYDCRPPILPVTVWLRGLRGPCVIRSAASSERGGFAGQGFCAGFGSCPGDSICTFG